MINRRLFLGLSLAALAPTGTLPAWSQEVAQDVAVTDDGMGRTSLDQVSAYFNEVKTLKGRFTQIAPSGELDMGTFYMRRPGRVRFDYDDPNPMVIVCDGTWVMLKDAKLDTVDRYPLKATPLKFLLKGDLNLAEEKRIVGVDQIPEVGLIITAREEEGDAQGEIQMLFAEQPFELKQWVITDAQGLQTAIQLSELEYDVKINNRLFRLKEEINPFKRY